LSKRLPAGRTQAGEGLERHDGVEDSAHFRLDPSHLSSEHRAKSEREESMLAKLAAYIQTKFLRRSRGIVAALEGERGQGTVEYVGLILLVSLLMIGMVAAMKGFNGKQGTELADLIVHKITEAVNAIAFK